jgi:hypothetical protein
MNADGDDASFYQHHKEDPELWGEPEESSSMPPDHLVVSITVRFPADEAALLRRCAREAGLPYSEVVRRAVRQFTQRHGVIDSDPMAIKSGAENPEKPQSSVGVR